MSLSKGDHVNSPCGLATEEPVKTHDEQDSALVAKRAVDTPSPTSKRRGASTASTADTSREPESTTPAPVVKRRRTGPRDKAAQKLAAEAAQLASAAENLEAEAAAAKTAADEAMQYAQTLVRKAAELKDCADDAKKVAEEAHCKAERAQLEVTKEGRDELKARDKAEKQAAKKRDQHQKLKEREETAASRTAIKNMGDAIKASMVIAKRGGVWEVPPGNVSFRNVTFNTFQTLFARGRCSFTPVNYCQSDPTISVVTKDAASIFGSTKVRGGSMYATFVITSMRATYVPATMRLTIAYDTDHGF
eukprot:TRINITY_DN40200_c0_g1_i1.p1 TRINITY_DN40200_c0_g1~~TRINITY_DN40200_c0_g1_i1.p1  ORF type:complete len:305 (+),score=67.50 TRINITY_DN40200_c0_g1_i1:54-968(+)